MMKNPRVARRYAVGLMAVAAEARSVDRTADDLALIGRTLEGARDLRSLVASPVVRASRKAAAFRALFDPRIAPSTLAFLDLLTAKGREALLAEVVEQFQALRDERLGVVTVDVAAAVELTPAQRNEMTARLERHTGKKVRLRVTLDPAVRGGLVVKIGDTVLDGSLRRQLELLRGRLAAGAALHT